MSGRKSRTKGHGYEREIARRFKEEGIFPAAKRHLESQKEEAKGYDLDNTGDFRFQLKRYKQYAPITKIEEVQTNDGEIPALITKGDRKRDVVVIYLDDFIELIKAR